MKTIIDNLQNVWIDKPLKFEEELDSNMSKPNLEIWNSFYSQIQEGEDPTIGIFLNPCKDNYSCVSISLLIEDAEALANSLMAQVNYYKTLKNEIKGG